ncbi:molybdenum cofactor biosynthesis protein MoaE [Streptomyces niveus]|uniref:molybdenum cofactor biosynthesis protein MoaE n=2 Tax=Streptomyces niveus TaxID=193462 RepID=UPI0020D269AC|nr:molybdenum cofactor biosynthesis protein MoaE [Streptomyces niveus]
MARIDAHPGEQAAQDPIRLLAIRESPLSVDEIFRAVGDDAAGGTALFVGTVRNHDSLLRLVHTFGDRFGAASFASGWQVCVTALAQVLGGGPVDIERDTAGTLHEAYLARFGELTRGRVEETDGGGRRVRFERQLVRPAEVVWARLTGGAEPLTGSPVPPGPPGPCRR